MRQPNEPGAVSAAPALAVTRGGADMADATCTVDGCERRGTARGGLCASHCRRLDQYGDPLAGPPIRPYVGRGPQSRTLEERLWSKTAIPENPLDCWLWIGATNAGNGYGVLQVNGKRQYAHRVSYQLSIDTIGRNLEIDHLCRVRNCINPLHLQAVPASINSRRRPDRSVTHCPRGHRYSGDNLYEYDGHRICRACRVERAA